MANAIKNSSIILLLLLMGYWTTQWAESNGARNYQEQNRPSNEWWNGGLGALGYQKIEDTRLRTSWGKRLPSEAVELGGIFENRSQNLILILEDSLAHETWNIWQCSGAELRPSPQEWSHLGKGWKGALQIKKCPTSATRKTLLTRKLIDPKEIRY